MLGLPLVGARPVAYKSRAAKKAMFAGALKFAPSSVKQGEARPHEGGAALPLRALLAEMLAAR